MNIVLLGATGLVGSAILKEALDRGHAVTAVARSPDKLEPRERLVVRLVDVHDVPALAAIINGQDALISAFNPGWESPRLYEEQVRGTRDILAAIHRAGLKRVLWVGGAGGLEVKSGGRLMDDPDFPEWVKPGARGTFNALEQLRQESELDWSFLAPAAILRPGARTGKFRLGGDKLLIGPDGSSQISLQDYAMAMIDELERPGHIRQRFTVGY